MHDFCYADCVVLGLDEVGIYRLSGIASEVKSLKTAFDESEFALLCSLSIQFSYFKIDTKA